MSLAISIFGLGYVGSVSAACFAHLGHTVIGVDVNPTKVEMLQAGQSPIVEARMDELVAEGRVAGRLFATSDSHTAIHESEISFLCVGTPGLRSGKLDLCHVRKVACEIGTALRSKERPHLVVLRSTVLPGTTESEVVPILENAIGIKAGGKFTVCYNPEFLREGSAVADFLQPPCTILGGSNSEALVLLRELYAGIPGEIFEVPITVAEMAKYVSNAFHALKVGFANEIGTLCKALGVDTEAVTRIFMADKKLSISPAYLSAGFAFGGSCLPKDLLALTHRAKELDLSLPLLDSILPSNARHLERATDMVLETGKMKVALLGLSFKAGTDDLRDSPQVRLVKRLLGEGRSVRVWDDHVSLGCLVGSNRRYIEEVIPHIGSLLCPSLAEAVEAAEVIVVGTTNFDRDLLHRMLTPEQSVIDLVNLESSRRPVAASSYAGICW